MLMLNSSFFAAEIQLFRSNPQNLLDSTVSVGQLIILLTPILFWLMTVPIPKYLSQTKVLLLILSSLNAFFLLVKSNSFLLKSTFCPLKFPPLPVTSSFLGDFNGFHQEFCELEPTHKGASVESWGAWANAPTCFLASTLILVQQMDSVLPATRRRDPFCHCKGERPVRKRMFSA